MKSISKIFPTKINVMKGQINTLAFLCLFFTIPLFSGCAMLLTTAAMKENFGKEINIQNLSSNNYLSVSSSGILMTKVSSQKKDQAIILGNFKDFALSINHEFKTLSSHPNNAKSLLFTDYNDKYLNQSKFDFVSQDSTFNKKFKIKSRISGLYLTEKDGQIIMDNLYHDSSLVLNQVWQISPANLQGERIFMDGIVKDGPNGANREMLERHLFNELKPALDKLRSDGIIGENTLKDKSKLGEIINTNDLSDAEKKIYEDFKTRYKVEFERDFKDDWLNLNASVKSNTSDILQDIRGAIATENTANLDDPAFQKLKTKLRRFSSRRQETISLFKYNFDNILYDWYEQAQIDVDNIYRNMSLEAEHFNGESPDIFGLIREAVSIPAGANAVTGNIMSVFNLSLNVISEMSKEGTITVKNPSNTLNESVSDYKQEYFDIFRELRRGLTDYMYIVISDTSLLVSFTDNFQTIDVSNDLILEGLTNQTRKALFKSLIPIKGILVGMRSQNDEDSFKDESLPLSLNPLAHIGVEQATCELHEKGTMNTTPYEYNIFYQLKIRDDDYNLYSRLGEGGNCGLTELRQLWEPDSIYNWLKSSDDKIFVDHLFLRDNEKQTYPRLQNDEYNMCYDDVSIKKFSEITPESFELFDKEAFIELTFVSMELIDEGKDPGNELELFGNITLNFEKDNLDKEAIETQSGFSDENLWDKDASDDWELVKGAPATFNKTYKIRIKNKEEFNNASPTFELSFNVTDWDDNPNDYLSCDNCSNDDMHKIDLNSLYNTGGRKMSLTLKNKGHEVKVNFLCQTIYN